eukprot:CAMPEP_0184968298 /NCGR_PEP_ID=MMETSP1098-20130426/1392_1 /TAXON_ID=89044 /ORGANISM="Spumella elongata, Strain CCAP 955/1" /LENGTH=129 /DNA_ID=CAMNT_0027489887 /DNA_START=78 /DNA_END=467 /DNA_ORIENTATION=+
MELEPNQTIYINNINEKVKKDVLKKQLYMLFSQYGKVKQIVACKGIRLRGQAWIVFHDLNSAINAMKGKQGFVFYDKPMKLAFAKTKSLIVARQEGKGKPDAASSKSSKRGREEEEDEEAASAKEARNL